MVLAGRRIMNEFGKKTERRMSVIVKEECERVWLRRVDGMSTKKKLLASGTMWCSEL
jgi:hypothetical protein